MKPFEELTLLGKLRRETATARKILAAYPIQLKRLDLISYDTNFIYRVKTKNGKTYILRLAFPGWRSPEDSELEAAWLEALSRDTDLNLPRLLLTSDGEWVARVGKRHAVLMDYLPGMLLGKRLTPVNIQKMGVLFGKLHLHAASWKPPQGLSQKVFAGYLSRGEPNVLFDKDNLPHYERNDLKTVQQMSDKVNAAYASLDRSDLHVIHCDLWHDNIKLYRGELAPFDFEDAIMGFRLHDMAMALLDLAEDTDTQRYYKKLLPAFRSGYESRMLWPDGSLETLQMGRVLWRLNWVARNMPESFPDAVRFNAALFRRFEQTGRLADPLRG